MKKNVFILILSTLFILTFNQESLAQIKVHQDGQITFQHNNGNWNHGVQIFPSGCIHFNTTQTNEWHWVTVASPKNAKGKCWIVTYPDGETDPAEQKKDHRFFVTGDGYVHKRGGMRMADASLQTGHETIKNPGMMLDAIQGHIIFRQMKTMKVLKTRI